MISRLIARLKAVIKIHNSKELNYSIVGIKNEAIATESMPQSQKRKVIVVLGATGCGKTKLAIELCQKFDGEAISTDSMQLYQGLKIATNQVTEEEARGVPHHMIGVLHPLTLGYTVTDFRNEAIKIIDDIQSRGKLPVIVGGTNYYIEALLWKILLNDDREKPGDKRKRRQFENMTGGVPEHFADYSNEQLYEELKKVDPLEAGRTLPGARRRVIRCLQYYYAENRPISEAIEEQRAENGGSYIGGLLRFEDSIFLWVQCDKSVLEERLNARLDKMLAEGLVDELCQFYDKFYKEYTTLILGECNNLVLDSWTKGVFQCIGLKEFRTYLELSPEQRSMMEPGQRGRIEYEKCVELMRVSNRQYATKQIRWIRNRCLVSDRPSPPLYGFDGTSVEDWTKNVSEPASLVVDHFLRDQPQSIVIPLSKIDPKVRGDMRLTKKCDVCQKTMIGYAWKDHVDSYAHRWNVRKRDDLLKEVTETLDDLLKRLSRDSLLK